MTNIKELFDTALREHLKETDALRFLPESRCDRSWWPTLGQYDWFCGQLLYCLIRHLKPKRMVEISTSSGFSTVYSAMALKANGGGIIHTFELDPKVAAGASRTFERLKLSEWIDLNVGDAKITVPKKPEIKEADILFLDSLHTAEFMRWFLEAVVAGSREDALFHVHDVLPRHARVRCRNAPGRGLLFDLRKYIYDRFVAGLPANEVVWPKVLPPQSPGELPSYNGIETMEAVLANELASRMGATEQLFAHDLAAVHPEAEPGRYASMSVGRQDSFGKPCEWNDSWWATSGGVLKAYEKWKADGHPLTI